MNKLFYFSVVVAAMFVGGLSAIKQNNKIERKPNVTTRSMSRKHNETSKLNVIVLLKVQRNLNLEFKDVCEKKDFFDPFDIKK